MCERKLWTAVATAVCEDVRARSRRVRRLLMTKSGCVAASGGGKYET